MTRLIPAKNLGEHISNAKLDNGEAINPEKPTKLQVEQVLTASRKFA
jgi:hypothetical protein